MSIKNSSIVKKLLSKYIVFILSMMFLCLIPGPLYSWFSSPAGTKNDTRPPGFTTNSFIPDILSNTYVLHYNTSVDDRESAIFLDFGNNANVFADRINIDIPLIILTKEAIDPEESIDRLLAANLRIQNILDEYLALKKRTELLLKDLRIPYLEKHKNKVKPKSAIAGEVREGENLKKDIENIIRYSAGNNMKNYEEAEQFVAAIQQIHQAGAGIKTDQKQGNDDAVNQVAGSGTFQKLSTESMGKQYDNELPWIFRFILGILKYAYNNRLEIMLWAVVASISILFVTLVAKR